MEQTAEQKRLELFEKKVRGYIRTPPTSARELAKANMEMWLTLLPYLYQQHEDHRKTAVMFAVFRPALAVMSALGMLILGTAYRVFTGEARITPGGH